MIIMKGAIMYKTISNLPLGGLKNVVYGPQTDGKVGTFGALAVIAFVVMLLALYAPEISTIGEGIGIDYNLIP